MPDVSRTEIGRRIFILNKEKHAEMAIEKIRRKLGPEWNAIQMEEITLLRHLIGEVWVFTERSIWDKIAFSEVNSGDLYQIIGIGREIKSNKVSVQAGIEQVVSILQRHTFVESERYQ